MRLPIRARMTLGYTALLVLTIAGLGTFVVVQLRTDLTRAIDSSLMPSLERIAVGYRAEGPKDLRDAAASSLSGERAAAQALDGPRGVVASFGDRVARAAMIDAGAVPVTGVIGPRTVRLGRAGRFRLAARRVTRQGRSQVVVAALSLRPVERSVSRVILLLLLGGPAAVLLTGATGWWLARRSLRPVERMTREAESITTERIAERVTEPATSDEVAHLARTFNLMLDRVQRGVEGQRRLVADASHELRTPLAAMRAELDVSLRIDDLSPPARGVLESAREEVDRLGRMVEDLLTLAVSDEGGLVPVRRPVDLRALAGEVVAMLGPLAVSRDVRLEAGGSAAAVEGDSERLRDAVRNIVENAIKFSPAGGRVGVRTGIRGRWVTLAVSDEGPGVPVEHRTRIFERFFRLDAARTRAGGGSGLGLAITRDIVAAHGGSVSVCANRPAGSVFEVELPNLREKQSPSDEGELGAC